MSQTIEAVYDGTVLRPDAALALPPNTRVRVTVEALPADPPAAGSFLRALREAKLDGPPDWSTSHDEYPHGRPEQPEP